MHYDQPYTLVRLGLKHFSFLFFMFNPNNYSNSFLCFSAICCACIHVGFSMFMIILRFLNPVMDSGPWA
jgi:hypothetical protein